MALLMGAACLMIAPPALGAGIADTKHNLSTGGTAGMFGSTDESEICVFCHVPHHSSDKTPLWNHDAPTWSFSLYNSSTLNATVEQPTGDSLLCMSCHDGIIAINALVAPQSGTPAMDPLANQIGDIYWPGSLFGWPGPNIGEAYNANPNSRHLENDHPVSFTFDNTLINDDGGAGLQLPPGGSPVELKGAASDRVECSSCHNPHDDTFGAFLVDSNVESQLCLVCHVK